MTRAIDFEEFAAERGAGRHYGDPELARSNSSVPATTRQRAIERQTTADRALSERRDALRTEYDRLVATGAVRPLTRVERLIQVAAGHADNRATQAARRLLARLDELKEAQS